MFIEDVRDAVGDLVEIIQTYQSKGRISQVMTSTLFKRRQEEAEAIIDAAVCRLQVSAVCLALISIDSTLQSVTSVTAEV